MTLLLRNLFYGILLMILTAFGVGAQTPPVVLNQHRAPLTPLIALVGPQISLENELRLMSGQAAVIFTGEVLSVQHHGSGSSSDWVEIEFRVINAIRGCLNLGTYRLREWASLWTGLQRYQVGQQLLMFLHAPGASGLSSPVDDQDGAIPILGTGAAPGPHDSFMAAGDQAVDLRWVQAHLLRQTSSGHGSLHGTPITPVGPLLIGKEQAPLTTRKVAYPDPPSPQQALEVDPSANQSADESLQTEAPLHGVLAMLEAWESQQANAAQ